MINLVFPYTTNFYREPLHKCIRNMEMLDIVPIVGLFQTFGTDVLFFQDKNYGPIIPYSQLLALNDNFFSLFDENIETMPTVITVFKTPFIENVFHALSQTMPVEIIYKLKIHISSANDNTLYINDNVYDTITLFNKEGNLDIDLICELIYNLKPEDTHTNISQFYWSNVFGYTLAPMNIATSYDLVKSPIICNFKYAKI